VAKSRHCDDRIGYGRGVEVEEATVSERSGMEARDEVVGGAVVVEIKAAVSVLPEL